MLDFISKDVREYMAQNNLKFTDFEKAALIYHAHLPVWKRQELLKKLAEETQDKALKRQIRERFAYEREEWKVFQKNTDEYLFAVEPQTDDEKSFVYACLDTVERAYALGRTLEHKFAVNKYRIAGFDADKMVPREYPMGTAMYDKDGKMVRFWTPEIVKLSEEELEKYSDLTRFEHAFIAVPSLFERGDIVRSTMNPEDHGVIVTSQQRWKEYLEQIKSKETEILNFYHSRMTVEFLQADGSLTHDNVNPAFLEKYEPKESDKDYDVLTTGRDILRENRTLSFFMQYMYCMRNYQTPPESKLFRELSAKEMEK